SGVEAETRVGQAVKPPQDLDAAADLAGAPVERVETGYLAVRGEERHGHDRAMGDDGVILDQNKAPRIRPVGSGLVELPAHLRRIDERFSVASVEDGLEKDL